MRTRQSTLQHWVTPRQQVLGPPSLRAVDILPASSWPVKKKRTKLSASTAVAGLDLPKCSNGLPASGTSTGSSRDEEAGRQTSDAGTRPRPVLCYTRRKYYKRRKILSPCVRAAASATTSTLLTDECDDAGDAQDECKDAADAHDGCEDAQGDCDLAREAEDNLEAARDAEDAFEVNGDTGSNRDLPSGLRVYPVALSEYSPGDVPVVAISTDDELRTTGTPSDVEMSEKSGPSSWSPTTGELSPSIRKRRDVAPSVSAIIAEIKTNRKKPEAVAAGAVVRRRPQRQKKLTSRAEFVDTSTPEFEWTTYYPDVPFPEGEDELGAVEPITNGSEGDPSDISDSGHKPYSLKLQTDIQKTCKARRIFPSTASPDEFAPPPPPLPAAGAPRSLPQETSLFLDPQTPEKLQESNGECEMGIRTSATPSESTAVGDDKDSSWTPSDEDSARNGGRRSHSPVTVSVKISGRTPEGSRLLQNIYPESATFKAKDLKLKVKKKRPRPKVWRPEKVKMAKRAKATKLTSNGQRHPPVRGASEQKNMVGGGAAAAAVCDHSSGATPLRQNVQFNVQQQQNEHSSEAAGLASVSPPAVMPDTSIATEVIDNVMAFVSDQGTTTVDLTSPKVTTLARSGPTCEVGAGCSFALEQVVDLGALELTMEKTISEMDLKHRLVMNVDRSIPNLGGFPIADGSNSMDDPPCTPRDNMLAVVPACEPFLNSESFRPEENAFGGGDSSDSDDDQRSHVPTRRKRSNLSQRTRRSLLPAVESAAAAAAAAAGPAMGINTPVAASVRVKQKFKQLICLEPSPARASALRLQSMDSDAQEPLPLVVYRQRSTDMVMYQDMMPRSKHKPKVYLDSLTCDTFQRLMLQGGMANDADHADEDWFAARKLWSNRAREFNGIMRRVQGDRAFSKWKGSVLDSIIGAFLTQNVSDFLSSNAFMSLRARFPVCEDTHGVTDASTQERSSLAEAMPNECSVGTSVGVAFRGPQSAGEHEPMAGSDELVNAVSIDNQQECASPMPDAETQNGSGVADECVMDSLDATILVESQATMVAFVNSPSGAGSDADQSDPYSFSGDDRNAEKRESGFSSSDIVELVGQVQLGLASVALGSCPSIGMASPSAIRDELLAANVADATPLFPATIAEVPTSMNTEPGSHTLAHPSAPEPVAITDVKEQVDHSAGAAQHSKAAAAAAAASSKDPSVLQDKFGLSWDDKSATPDGTERALAAALRAILGKQITGREQAAETGNRVPLKPLKSRQPRNKQRLLDMSKFKPNIRLLTGRERANYEFSVDYKLDSEQKGTWEACRAELLLNKASERDPFTAHSVDWEEVRRAPVAAIANVIKERGMNNILGGRIKSLLDRIHRDQDGSLDLEWVRKLSPVDAQNFLTSIRGLGIKSVECIRLLTLHHPSFPVDTNVGRIVVRLGWVPLEPLPEETQLHLLEMYPVQEHIQKYIWPRLCTLDQETLYEFHYQLITFGKVFCTKSKPNCNACPLRSQCKHYESAYSRARPLLMGPEEALNDSSEHQIVALPSRSRMQTSFDERQRLWMLEGNARESGGACVPIIEEPNSPEYIQDIEDIPFTEGTDSVEVVEENIDLEPSARGGGSMLYVELNQTSAQHVSQEFCMDSPSKGAQQEPDGCIEAVVEELTPQVPSEEVAFPDSRELVLLPPQAASYPAPQLKNVQRLRTIHYVYELPDHHPLLAKMDKRDPEDPCFYLLAIWNSDEVPDVMPKISDDDASNPFACSQSGEESVRGTLLVPCRTAMKGSFPLNGTYFQVNEVFADHGSSIKPIEVPRTFLWNLKRRFVYFGTSVTSIFKDMSQEEIQCCFKKGYICVRAFDQITRYPKLLAARLHQSGAKIVAARAVGLKGRRASQSKVASLR